MKFITTVLICAAIYSANCESEEDARKALCADSDDAAQMFAMFYNCSVEVLSEPEFTIRKDCFKETFGEVMPSNVEAVRKILCIPENYKKMNDKKSDACETRLGAERKVKIDNKAQEAAADACINKKMNATDAMVTLVDEYCTKKAGSMSTTVLGMMHKCEQLYSDKMKEVGAKCFKDMFTVDRPATFEDEMKAVCANKDMSLYKSYKICVAMTVSSKGLTDEEVNKKVKACMS